MHNSLDGAWATSRWAWGQIHVHLPREHHITNSTQYVLFMCRQKYQAHFTALHCLTCFWDDLKPKNTSQALLLQEPQVMLNSPFSSLLQGRGNPGHLNSRHPQNSYCLQTVRTDSTWTTSHTSCAQQFHSGNSCHSKSAHFFLEKLWSIALPHTTEGLRQTFRNFAFWWTNSIRFFYIYI